MTTTHGAPENSARLAFAELERLERARADFAHTKQTARARLTRQVADLLELRARFEAERPRARARARARARRAAERSRELRERAAAEALASAELEHRERVARYRDQLEAKRRQLAALEAEPVVERPSRRLLEWSVPAAATLLVAFMGFTLMSEEIAEAAEPAMVVELDEPTPELLPAVLIPLSEPEPEPEPEPEQPKAKKPEAKKPKAKKPKAEKPEAKKPKSGHSNPLILGDLGGDPLS